MKRYAFDRCILVMGILLGAALLAGEVSAAEAPSGKAIKPYVVFSGSQSKIEKPEIIRIASRKAWTEVWCRHVGLPRQDPYHDYYNRAGVPAVDFDRCMVVAIFQGRASNSAGVDALSITEEEGILRFRYDDRSFQTVGGAESVSAFGIFILPRSGKPVVVEENVQGLKGKPPVWRERARLSGGGRSMKGWELYSWRIPGDKRWRFSLLHGTNMLKTFEGVTGKANALVGIEALKDALRELMKGQEVIWHHDLVKVPAGKPAFAFPPEGIVREIADFCKSRGLSFTK
ncbi:MAG: hypothetical protein ACYTHM_00215 [Planctomycetota bacterium]|jgi:hypothetical protein